MAFQDEIEALFRKLKPLLGEEADALWIAYNTQTDLRSKAEIAGLLYSLASKYLNETYEKRLLLNVPDEKEIDGEYRLGNVVYSGKELYPFGLRENEWLRHAAIFGTTGSGKTNCAFLILRELARRGKPFLVFDWKRNYRDLIMLDEFKDVKVYTVGRDASPFYFNPLVPPPGTKAETWLKKLIEIICHAYFLGEGVAFLLQKAIDRVYQEKGVYDGSSDYPTFLDVLRVLEGMKVKGRKALWMDSTLRTLGVLCFGEFGRVLNAKEHFDISKILCEKAVLELDALTNADKTFFTEALLLWIHCFRLSEGKREIFKHALVIEEAHHILLRKKQEASGNEAVTDVILREIRELGEGVVLIDQHPSLISLPALGNTYATICFGLKHRSDMLAVGESLLLDRDEVEFLGQLEAGTAIVKLQGRYFKPFVVRFPLFSIEKGSVSDEEIRRRMSGCKEESEEVRLDIEIEKLVRSFEGLVKEIENSFGIEKGEQNEAFGKLSEEEKRFLSDIARCPLSGVVSRYARLGLNRYQGNKIQHLLLSKGLITWRTLSTRKGRLKILVLTDEGKKAIPDVRMEKVFYKRAGWDHEYWKHKVGEYYRKKGYSVSYEHKLDGGKSVDIVAEKDGRRIAVEIETGKSDAVYNIRKALEAGFDEVVVIAVDEKVKRELEDFIERNAGLLKGKNVNVLDTGFLNNKSKIN